MAHPAFRYSITFDGLTIGAFTECTLPVVNWEVQEIKEGGQNTSLHVVPGRRKKVTLTLKNGIVKDGLFDWCVDTMNEKFVRKSVTVTMMGVDHEPMISWHLEDAFPTKWTFPQFKTDANAIAIHTIELTCGALTVEEAG